MNFLERFCGKNNVREMSKLKFSMKKNVFYEIKDEQSIVYRGKWEII